MSGKLKFCNDLMWLCLALAAAVLPGCRAVEQTGRRTVPYVESIFSEKGQEWGILSSFDSKDPRGSIAVIGPEGRNDSLLVRFLNNDDFDNIDGRKAPDALPDFAGERVDVIYDSVAVDISDVEEIRTLAVRRFLSALDTACSLGAFDNEKLALKQNSKIIIFSDPVNAEFGAFDIDTLCRMAGKNIPVIFPSRLVFSQQFDRNLPHAHIAVVTDPETAASGVYPRVFDGMAAERGIFGCGCIAISRDSLSTLGSLLDRYKGAGGMMPLSAIVIDDPAVSSETVRKSLEDILSVQTESNLNWRKLITKEFTVVDMRKSVTDECYRILRQRNIFTHDIAYPTCRPYLSVRANEGDGVNLVERN